MLTLRYVLMLPIIGLTVLLVAGCVPPLQVTGPADSARPELSGGRVETCGGGRLYLNAKEKRILELHDQARKRRGLEPLCVHPALTEAARAHSREMIERDYFSHESYRGASLVERLERFGYTTGDYGSWKVAGNIAWGNHSEGAPGDVFEGWMNSPDHRPHILSEDFRQVGVGASTGTYKSYEETTMYTVDFGVRRRQ